MTKRGERRKKAERHDEKMRALTACFLPKVSALDMLGEMVLCRLADGGFSWGTLMHYFPDDKGGATVVLFPSFGFVPADSREASENVWSEPVRRVAGVMSMRIMSLADACIAHKLMVSYDMEKSILRKTRQYSRDAYAALPEAALVPKREFLKRTVGSMKQFLQDFGIFVAAGSEGSHFDSPFRHLATKVEG
jgi:hypothetical protein